MIDRLEVWGVNWPKEAPEQQSPAAARSTTPSAVHSKGGFSLIAVSSTLWAAPAQAVLEVEAPQPVAPQAVVIPQNETTTPTQVAAAVPAAPQQPQFLRVTHEVANDFTPAVTATNSLRAKELLAK